MAFSEETKDRVNAAIGCVVAGDGADGQCCQGWFSPTGVAAFGVRFRASRTLGRGNSEGEESNSGLG